MTYIPANLPLKNNAMAGAENYNKQEKSEKKNLQVIFFSCHKKWFSINWLDELWKCKNKSNMIIFIDNTDFCEFIMKPFRRRKKSEKYFSSVKRC